MNIEQLKQKLKEKVGILIETREFNTDTAPRMSKQHIRLKQTFIASSRELKALDAALLQAQEEKNTQRIEKVGDARAEILAIRKNISKDITEYRNTIRSRNLKEKKAKQGLQRAIDALRRAEGKPIQPLVPRHVDTNEQSQLALRRDVLNHRINENEHKLATVKSELQKLLRDTPTITSLRNQAGAVITPESLHAALEQIQRGNKTTLTHSKEIETLAEAYSTLTEEMKKLDNKLESIKQSKEKNSLYRLFFPLIAYFIGYAQDKTRHAGLKEKQATAGIMASFKEANKLMAERERIRVLEIEHEEKILASTKALAHEEQTLLDLRRDFHAYCSAIDTLDESEKPMSGSIVVDKAIAATSTFVTDTAQDVQKWGEGTVTEISKGAQKFREKPTETLSDASKQIKESAIGFGQAIAGFWNRTIQDAPEKEPEQEPLLSGRESPTPSSGSTSPSILKNGPIPESVQQVAKSLRVFLGEPSYINLELLMHCMEENPTYSTDAPDGFNQLLEQTVQIYPELDERIQALTDTHEHNQSFKA